MVILYHIDMHGGIWVLFGTGGHLGTWVLGRLAVGSCYSVAGVGEQEVGSRGHQHCRGRGQAGEAPMLARTLLGLLARARVGTRAKARARERGHKGALTG